MAHYEAPEMAEFNRIKAGYDSAFHRGDRQAVIAIVDNEIRYLESLPQGLNMWRNPGGVWVDVGTMLALARQRRERFNVQHNGNRWPWR